MASMQDHRRHGTSGRPGAAGSKKRAADRLTQGILGAIVWWTAYWHLAPHYGAVGASLLATVTGWAFILLCMLASPLLEEQASRNPEGPRTRR